MADESTMKAKVTPFGGEQGLEIYFLLINLFPLRIIIPL